MINAGHSILFNKDQVLVKCDKFCPLIETTMRSIDILSDNINREYVFFVETSTALVFYQCFFSLLL